MLSFWFQLSQISLLLCFAMLNVKSQTTILTCSNLGEIYSSAWITTRKVFIENNRLLLANLSYVNGEQSTFLMIDWRKRSMFSNVKVKPPDSNEITGNLSET